jgi:uncharacterized protein involved in tolerance to divalent cations
MKTYISILFLFCTVGLSYGSSRYGNSHVTITDSVVKNRADTIQIVSNGIYKFRGKYLKEKQLKLLLKTIESQQVYEAVNEYKVKKTESKMPLFISLGVFLSSIAYLFANIEPILFTPTFHGGTYVLIGFMLGFILEIAGLTAKKKANRLKRKAVELYNEIVKSGK